MFTPEARVDIEDAHAWYEMQRPGMGEHFRHELDRLWCLLEQFPTLGRGVHRDFRRALVRHFPYAVYYLVVGDTVEIRACLDQRLDPREVRRRADR
jgi:plasmid stabilization system protein ParE